MGNDVALPPTVATPLLHLVQSAAAGDAIVANQLLTEVRPYLRSEVEKLLRTNRLIGAADASDVVQGCLVALWRHLPNIYGVSEGEIHALVKAIARNETLDMLRHAHQPGRDFRRQVSLSLESGHAIPLAADTSSPSQQATRRGETVVLPGR